MNHSYHQKCYLFNLAIALVVLVIVAIKHINYGKIMMSTFHYP